MDAETQKMVEKTNKTVEETKRTLGVVTVVAVVAAVAAVAALTVGIIAFIKAGRLTADDQPITVGGGSLHLHPSTGWDAMPADADHPTSYLKHTSASVDYSHVDWACSDDVDTAAVNMRANPQATVTLVYAGPGNRSNTLIFKKESPRVMTLTITDRGAAVSRTMIRHLIEFGQHGKGKWKYESIASTNLFSDLGAPADISCPANSDGDFFLQFRP